MSTYAMRLVLTGGILLAIVASFALPGGPVAAAPDTGGVPDPEMIGPGVISTPDDELGGGVTPDGKTLIFEKSAAPHYLYIMCESHLVNGEWSAPEILPRPFCLLRIGL